MESTSQFVLLTPVKGSKIILNKRYIINAAATSEGITRLTVVQPGNPEVIGWYDIKMTLEETMDLLG